MERDLIEARRFYHKIAEPGFLEFKTTINIIKDLKELGISDIKYGKEIHKEDLIFGRPSSERLKAYANTIKYRKDFDTSEILQGYTGVIASLDTGKVGKILPFVSTLTPCLLEKALINFTSLLEKALHQKIHVLCTLVAMMATFLWESS